MLITHERHVDCPSCGWINSYRLKGQGEHQRRCRKCGKGMVFTVRRIDRYSPIAKKVGI